MINSATVLFGLMQAYSNLGIALKSDLTEYIYGRKDANELPARSLPILQKYLNEMSIFDIDGSIDSLLADIDREIEFLE